MYFSSTRPQENNKGSQEESAWLEGLMGWARAHSGAPRTRLWKRGTLPEGSSGVRTSAQGQDSYRSDHSSGLSDFQKNNHNSDDKNNSSHLLGTLHSGHQVESLTHVPSCIPLGRPPKSFPQTQRAVVTL